VFSYITYLSPNLITAKFGFIFGKDLDPPQVEKKLSARKYQKGAGEEIREKM
jgi:hypothetical protein